MLRDLHQEETGDDFKLADVILGGQDGLVNVLGVILGVAAASNDSRLVLAAGFAATFAESVSMAAVAYTSKRAKADHYESRRQREIREIEEWPERKIEEVRKVYKRRGFEEPRLSEIVQTITGNKKIWLEIMMQEELKLEPIESQKILGQALLVGVSAIVGSLVPLLPFIFLKINSATVLSLFVSGLSLWFMGVYKARVTVGQPWRSGLEITIIGLASAFTGYLVGLVFRVG